MILDDVINMDAPTFQRHVFLMAIFSLISGVFGGIRGLCFSVVGKRVLKTLQDKLFGGVIIQDIAYFDATTSGEVCEGRGALGFGFWFLGFGNGIWVLGFGVWKRNLGFGFWILETEPPNSPKILPRLIETFGFLELRL